MFGIGLILVAGGAAGFILPLMGVEHEALSILGENTRYAAGGLIGVGLVMIFLAKRKAAKAKKK